MYRHLTTLYKTNLSPGDLYSIRPPADNPDGFVSVGVTAPYSQYTSNGQRWIPLSDDTSTQVFRKAIMRPYWVAYTESLKSRPNQTVASIGTVYYLDPTAATNGTGTLTSPFNTLPPYTTWAGNTLLIKEGTVLTTAINVSTSATRLMGTYSAYDGSRLFDKSRAATIYVTSSSIAVNLGSTTTGNKLYFSCLRVTGATNLAGVSNLIYLGNAGTSSEVVLEYCVFDTCIGSVGSVNTHASIRTERLIVRYCTFVDKNADLLWVRPDTLGYAEIYGNEFIVSESTNLEGPDCVQFTRNTGQSWTYVRIYGNWFDHQTSGKQALIVANNAPTSGERLEITRNYFFGVDTSIAPEYSGDGAGAKAILTDGYSISITGNYVDNFRIWVNTRGSSTLPSITAFNIFISDERQWSVPSGSSKISCGVGYNYFFNNTLIFYRSQVVPAGSGIVRFTGSTNVIKNNLLVGPVSKGFAFDSGASQAESSNVFSQSVNLCVVNLSGVEVPTTSSRVNDNAIDGLGRILSGESIIGTAIPVSVNGPGLIYEDPFGYVADPSRLYIGACQRPA